VTVVAPEVVPAIVESGVRIAQRRFRASDLDDVWFVVAAAPPEVNRHVAELAEARQIFVNAVDDPAHASAYLGGVVRKQGVTLAISTGGRAPALAGLLREGLEAILPDDVGQWLGVSDRAREIWKREQVPMTSRRPSLLQAINSLYEPVRPSTGSGRTDDGREASIRPDRVEGRTELEVVS
jgi:uroporphyrin-III C-methyltransferase/precorrin-2 dehydrogenase/sirohydrochlorin ferrochelatase